MCARLSLACAGGLLLSCFALAQSAEEVRVSVRNTPNDRTLSTQVALDTRFRVDVDLVVVPVTVTDSLGHSVVALTREDFRVYELDKLQEIRYFMTEEAPISIAVLFDVSKSMSDKIETEREAIVEFFKNANPDDEYFAIAFSGRPRLLVGPTESADDVERKLIAVERGGPTALLDAIYLAEFKLRTARYKRRAIVIISDGGDNSSRYTLREIKQLVRESDVQIYAIGLFETSFFNTLEEKLGKKWLSEITDVTGGRTITVDNREKVPKAAAGISREMRNQYILGYRPTVAKDGKWHKIRVRVNSSPAEPSPQASYRRGYTAPER